MLSQFTKNYILKNIKKPNVRCLFQYSICMKQLVQEISDGNLELELMDERGQKINDFPTTKKEDYIHTIYNIKYKNNDLGILTINSNNIKNIDSLISGLEHLVKDPVKIVKIFEYDKPYFFTKLEFHDFPITGYVKGKVI